MSSFSAFLEMGGYAAFVWPAFGIAAALLVGLLIASRRALRAREATLKELENRRPPRESGRGKEGAS